MAKHLIHFALAKLHKRFGICKFLRDKILFVHKKHAFACIYRPKTALSLNVRVEDCVVQVLLAEGYSLFVYQLQMVTAIVKSIFSNPNTVRKSNAG